ncbi:MAG: Rab family GTPase [Promethearchaeota archaeon]|jgi:Ras-related protein Rab-23
MTDGQKFGFKITVIGDGLVGKTSLIKKYTKGKFESDYVKTLGAQFSNIEKVINGDEIRLIFWDIAGQDDFLFLRPSFYRESKAAIIVCSLEENQHGKRSFENISKWHNDIKQFCGTVPIILFANKVDLINEEDFDPTELQEIVEKREFLGYYLTSAKTGKRVNEAFTTIIDELYTKFKPLST